MSGPNIQVGPGDDEGTEKVPPEPRRTKRDPRSWWGPVKMALTITSEVCEAGQHGTLAQWARVLVWGGEAAVFLYEQYIR